MEETYCIELIDDDSAWRESLADYLRGKGFRVLLAGSAEQGLNMLKKGGIRVIVCDYNLPDEDGLKLVRKIRALRLAVVILMVSSDDEPTLQERAFRAGVQAFLAKTAGAGTLLQKIRQLTGAPRHALTVRSVLEVWQRLLPAPFQDERRASA
jgi:DNA-binding response OmpR family regulator